MAKSTIAVIDYGMGNLHSVASALEHVGDNVEVLVSGDPEKILAADRVLFPGVGAIRDCMAEILRLGIDQVVAEAMQTKPLLAICVGMQALMQRSEENGGVDCLGFYPGEVKFFGEHLQDANGQKLKVPHMGWNHVHQQKPHPLWANIAQDERFYFVHSFYVQAQDSDMVMGTTDYGVNINAAISRDNVFAAQFHPEKSSTAGLQLLQNFLSWDGQS
ncbi:imidazole glycerol phosphate synthase subunit HisH [Dasania sp. GY-MA-18]|uniref:Imidazole glycerol phosphate synthase subunit HisH n=1 Tax=Dasania phycosphaerae TaxID=2950436 RepID=A0A9J6RLX8_9GAMM|nr:MULTISPECIES: imidazole glycerol phosphate synthase subunit HisH [Dasania]MCR8923029.1 imidazole glycerol phosphate synthase subunit HisH [Dasania sp. GY-MA-18]MCZ0865460.1 imidazole glycerol phosphate synthase subunit HisH [Dasania phycosphaerae]MCZ0869185.1 imidazole glycerol phosphate synthase subunit HisH [Dasania phycosphaerae]